MAFISAEIHRSYERGNTPFISAAFISADLANYFSISLLILLLPGQIALERDYAGLDISRVDMGKGLLT